MKSSSPEIPEKKHPRQSEGAAAGSTVFANGKTARLCLASAALLALNRWPVSAQTSTNQPDAFPAFVPDKLDVPAHTLTDTDQNLNWRKGMQTASVEAGAAFGMAVLGGSERHDMILGRIAYGYIFTDLENGPKWPRGYLEGRMELMADRQYSPKGATLVGLTPALRYHFETGTRWRPYVEAGAGVSVTDIGSPDLSTAFEFNLQGGAGLEYLLRKNLALTLGYRYFHVSNAGIASPNLGVNMNTVNLGVTWLF